MLILFVVLTYLQFTLVHGVGKNLTLFLTKMVYKPL